MEDYKTKFEKLIQRIYDLTVKGCIDEKVGKAILKDFTLESEDEKIRKAIIKLVKDTSKSYTINALGVDQKDMIDYLEKQGEQKPTDKVETKFKVGDWIINSEGMLRHILAVDKIGYQTDNGWLTHDIYDNTYHLWTIQDAKKGDILQINKCTLIFDSLAKDIDSNTVISSWYSCDTKTFYGPGPSEPDLLVTEGVAPATKEQRDLLFQKMKEAGYEWNAEKKVLKKIEQNSAWSEEDKETFGYLEDVVDFCYRNQYVVHVQTLERVRKLVSRLKSLCFQSEWSKDDITRIDELIETLNIVQANRVHTQRMHYSKATIDRDINWLKSLKERMKGDTE